MYELESLRQPTGRTHALNAMWLCLGAAAMCAVIPMVEHAVLYLLVLGMAATVLFPAWRDWTRGKLDFFEPVHLIGFIYFVYFGLGSVWTVLDPPGVAYDAFIPPYVTRATLFCLVGYITFLIGYYSPWLSSEPRDAVHERPLGQLFLVLVGGLGLLGSIASGVWTTAVNRGQSLPGVISSIGQLSPLFLFAWGLAWVMYFNGTMTRAQRMVLFGMYVPGVLLIGFLSFSDKSLAATLAGVPMICRWYTKRKLPWKTLLVMLLILVFIVFPLYNSFRWFDVDRGSVERMGMAVNLMQDWDQETYMKHSFGLFKRRMALINSVAVILRDVPRWEPFIYGRTIVLPFVAFWIPRVIWPEKPTTTLGQDFGQIFRVTDIWTSNVFIAPTVPGELYWNFGLPGILIGMWLSGLLARWLYLRYWPGNGPLNAGIQIMILVSWAHFFGSEVATSLVTLIRTLVVVALIRWAGHQWGLLTRVPPPR